MTTISVPSLATAARPAAGGGNINEQIERVKEKIQDTQDQISKLAHDDSLGPKEKKEIQQLLQAQLALLQERLRQLVEQRSERGDRHSPAQPRQESNPVTQVVQAVTGSVDVKV
ncbi:FlxA-like family protein [Jeongeupia naejangsanensis]|uniref:FlxA-like family protein n=1 Tax=Jeongeupia naejangsanensis TaxID=613195 RepID=A0ABS2BM86_9NEIS|nr:FlxA-like family protein [Jeongeupia naejangsanensis]MBM3116731.1 FlxA-like family protein [Jeongeupia naejangsanensis]